jgi:hypothetical protein
MIKFIGTDKIYVSIIPIAPAVNPIMRASALNTLDISFLRAPTLRNMPISFVRSMTDT